MRTLKLKLMLKSENQAAKEAEWKRLHQIFNDAYRAANSICTGQYMNDDMIRRIYARKKIDPKNFESVSQIEEEFSGFFGTKRQATTERDIRTEYPNLPSCITNPLNQVVFANYRKEKTEVMRGNRSLRSYHVDMPVQTTKISINFISEDNSHVVYWTLSKTEKIKFIIFYGKDKANNRLTVQRILEGINGYCAPMIQYKNRDLYLLVPVKEVAANHSFNPELSVGVDLGLAIPAYCALNDGSKKLALGSYEDFTRTRMQMQDRHRRLQRTLNMVSGGNGRTRKLKALDRISDKERNFARQYNHFLSKNIVDFTLKNNAGTIKFELLEGYGEDQKNNFVLRNWSYFELQTLTEDKGNRVGIKTLYVDPYRSSQICSTCGNYEEGQRIDQKTFKCKKCGNEINADYNAGLNIAKSDKYVTKKEDCEYHKNNKMAGLTAKG